MLHKDLCSFTYVKNSFCKDFPYWKNMIICYMNICNFSAIYNIKIIYSAHLTLQQQTSHKGYKVEKENQSLLA